MYILLLHDLVCVVCGVNEYVERKNFEKKFGKIEENWGVIDCWMDGR
jgi:hypothetical protein